jgi:cell division protein FtsW
MAGDEGYQLVQSFYALGNGGLFGTGFGMSRQKYQFLPYASSDFIFAIVAEEIGFVGACGIMLGFFALIYFGLRVAMRCPDRFGMLLATGITALIAVQVVINIAVVTGSMPTTGLPLPFFTAGGTALAIFMTEMGVLLSISRLKRVTEVRR